jgi:TM2 domain-containing membrane protein YozV
MSDNTQNPVAGAGLCPKCAVPLAAEAKFCPACGAPVASTEPAAMFCPQCGVKNDAAAQFCNSCGKPLTATVRSVEYAPIRMPPMQPALSRASNKIPAGICAILIGGLGVHKFILGYSGAGAIMLAVTLGSFVLGIATCGLLWPAMGAMHIIGLIEGIIYLTKSDEEFVRIYVDGRKEWF